MGGVVVVSRGGKERGCREVGVSRKRVELVEVR